MSLPPTSDVRLRRSPFARVMSGFWLQPFVTSALVLDLAVFVIIAPSESASDLTVSVLGPLLVILGWGFGVTAWARVDAEGVRWRYFRTHVQPWHQVEYVRFGTLYAKDTQFYRRLAILVAFEGREIPIMPTYGCSTRRVIEFGNAVVAAAVAHDRPAYVAGAERWQGLAMPAGVTLGDPPGGPLGRSRVPVSVQVRLFALALPVLGVLGLVGGITGWDTTGLGERIAVGIVGGVLLAVGALLVVVLFAGGGRTTSQVRVVRRDGMR